MASIKKRLDRDGNPRYYVQVRLKGHEPLSGSFTRKTDAKKWAQRVEADIRAGRYFHSSESQRRTLADLLNKYHQDLLIPKQQSGRHSQKHHIDWWKQNLGHLTLKDVTPAIIADARDKLSKEDTRMGGTKSGGTVNRYLQTLSHAFGLAVDEWQWAEFNPVKKVRKLEESQPRVRFLNDDERSRLLEACKNSDNPCLYDVVVLALSTGMRQSEILNLRWHDVNLERGLIVLHRTKNKTRRGIPVTGHALDCLRERSKLRRIDTDLVFPAPYHPSRPARPASIRNAWDSAIKRAGIEDFHFHDLRHTAASYLAMSGATHNEIAEILGHRVLEMVQRYVHLSESHTRGVLERLTATMFDDADSAR